MNLEVELKLPHCVFLFYLKCSHFCYETVSSLGLHATVFIEEGLSGNIVVMAQIRPTV
jgi:hypothetical protein